MNGKCKVRKTAGWAALVYCPLLYAQTASDLAVPLPLPPNSTLVLGFLGGYERWNDEHRSVRRLALRLRRQPGVYTETFSNRRRRVGFDLIRKALDTNRNGRLDPAEKASARIILYGQSWGGAAAIATARDLGQLGIPVLLTVQVDSVGERDQFIPANVRAAVNLYQHDPFTIWGRGEIRAADPAATTILGNFESTYVSRPIDGADSSWARRIFGGSHAKMEQDPLLWRQVEQYISDAISRR